MQKTTSGSFINLRIIVNFAIISSIFFVCQTSWADTSTVPIGLSAANAQELTAGTSPSVTVLGNVEVKSVVCLEQGSSFSYNISGATVAFSNLQLSGRIFKIKGIYLGEGTGPNEWETHVKETVAKGKLVLCDINTMASKNDTTDSDSDAPMLYVATEDDGKGDIKLTFNSDSGHTFNWSVKLGNNQIDNGEFSNVTTTQTGGPVNDLEAGEYTLSLTDTQNSSFSRLIKFTVIYISEVKVYNADAITDKIDKSGISHFINVKGNDMILEATVVPDTTTVRNALSWTAEGATVVCPGSGTDKRTVKLSSSSSAIEAKLSIKADSTVIWNKGTAWFVWADLAISIASNQSINTGNDAANLVANHSWPSAKGGGNSLGAISCENTTLTYAYTVGKIQAKAILAPAGIENIVSTSDWIIHRKIVLARDWDNAGSYVLGIWTDNTNETINGADTSNDGWQDSDPTSGSSEREIYDLDAPGCSTVNGINIYHTAETYANFEQFVGIYLQNKNKVLYAIRCSDMKNWSYASRIDVDKSSNKVELNQLKTSHITIPGSPHYSARFNISGTIKKNGTGLYGVTVSCEGKTATTDASGHYTVIGVPKGTGRTVTPSKTNETFSPANRQVDLIDQPITNIDFSAN